MRKMIIIIGFIVILYVWYKFQKAIIINMLIDYIGDRLDGIGMAQVNRVCEGKLGSPEGETSVEAKFDAFVEIKDELESIKWRIL